VSCQLLGYIVGLTVEILTIDRDPEIQHFVTPDLTMSIPQNVPQSTDVDGDVPRNKQEKHLVSLS